MIVTKQENMKKNTIYLSLGSNLNNRKANLKKALKELKKNQINLLKISSLYKTEPVGLKKQPCFLNIVVKGRTNLSPNELLRTISGVEKKLGRIRKKKWGPRIIDIDILLFNKLIIDRKDLIIPHPYLHKRNFALIPLTEISPDLIHPKFKKNMSGFIKSNSGKVEKLKDKI